MLQGSEEGSQGFGNSFWKSYLSPPLSLLTLILGCWLLLQRSKPGEIGYSPRSHVSPLLVISHRQDIAFFDANKTGQLVSRLATDVQEFKSSFKMVISQVSAITLLSHLP